MPEICIEAIQLIQAGNLLGEVEKKIIKSFPLEEVDIIDFAKQLIELELVEEVNGIVIERAEKIQQKLGLSWISPRLGRFFFNSWMKKGYAIIFLLNILLLTFNPQLFPHYKDAFVFEYMFQNVLFWILIGGILVLIHEWGHILSIRAHGLQTKLEVGHRLFLIVLETDLSLAWKLPSKDRIFLYFSGLCFDHLILFCSLAIQLLLPNSSPIFLGILGFIALDIIIRTIYQCCIYMKTDLYYVMENWTGVYNLMENAKSIIFRNKNELMVFEGELKTIYSYAVFFCLGLLFSGYILVYYYIPQIIYTIVKVAPGLHAPIISLQFLDAVIVLLQLIIMIGLLAYSWGKNILRAKSRLF